MVNDYGLCKDCAWIIFYFYECSSRYYTLFTIKAKDGKKEFSICVILIKHVLHACLMVTHVYILFTTERLDIQHLTTDTCHDFAPDHPPIAGVVCSISFKNILPSIIFCDVTLQHSLSQLQLLKSSNILNIFTYQSHLLFDSKSKCVWIIN